jgi:hypothetical protein
MMKVAITREEALAELARRRGQKQQAQEPVDTGPEDAITPENFNDLSAFGELAREQGPLKSMAINTGKGMYTIGRGLGLTDKPDIAEQRAMEALKKERPYTSFIGETLGEAIPITAAELAATGLAAAPIVSGATKKIAERVGYDTIKTMIPEVIRIHAPNVAYGTALGATISRGAGEDEYGQATGAALGGVTAGLGGPVQNIMHRYANKLFSKITGKAPARTLFTPDGLPSEELQGVLNKAGLDLSDLKASSIELIEGLAPDADPEQLARLARYKNIDPNFPVTKGDLTRDTKQQALEARLLESMADPNADPMRALRREQSSMIEGRVRGMAEETGSAKEFGESVKDALTRREENLNTRIRRLYGLAKKNANEIKDVPFDLEEFKDVLPNADDMRQISIYEPGKVKALKSLLAEFGLTKSKEALAVAQETGVKKITPLSVGNFDTFRKHLNYLMESKDAKYMANLIMPIKKRLDDATDDLISQLEDAGVDEASQKVIIPLKYARKTVYQMKREFSPKDIVGRLTDFKSGSNASVIEASQAYGKLVGKDQPIEWLQRSVDSLRKSGFKGKKAMGNLQAATMLDIIDYSTKAQTRMINGQVMVSPAMFTKKLKDIGEDRLKLIFQSNPKGYRDLMKISKSMEDLTVSSMATPKGSAAVNMDAMLSIIRNIPGLGPYAAKLAGGVATVSKLGASRMDMATAMKSMPDVKQTVKMLEQTNPRLLNALGVAALTPEGEDEYGENY